MESQVFCCTTTAEKYLSVVIDQNFNFHQQAAAAAAAKANRVQGLISKCFKHLDVVILPLLYKTLVRPILAYANAISLTERVQRKATKLVPSLKELPFITSTIAITLL